MATFVAPDTGKEYRIFGEGGGQLLAAELDTEVWAQIPIDPRLRAGSDAGVPLVVSDPDAPASQRIIEVATRMAKQKSSLVGRSLPLKF
jgi:ATP-binding protein involved in chromosome partitioning